MASLTIALDFCAWTTFPEPLFNVHLLDKVLNVAPEHEELDEQADWQFLTFVLFNVFICFCP